MTNGTSKEKEIAEAREKTRGYALQNLKAANLSNLAVAYGAQSKDSGFGETDNAAVEQFLYRPSIKGSDAYNLQTGEKSDLVYGSLLSSRQDGRRYSGQVSEYGMLQRAASITQESLLSVKVSDVMEIIGSKVPVKKGYEGRYIADLLESKNKEDQEVANAIVGMYMGYITTTGVSKSLGMRAQAIKGGLEKLVGASAEDEVKGKRK
ncbi:MAG: hypothetical protein AABX76_02300 [Nanoarchaeota archaeon]